jgi:ketosteroid isomerase-like protein
MSQENVEMVRRFFAAFGNRQAEDLTDDALKQFFDSEVEWIPIPQGVLAGNRNPGFEGIRRFRADFIAAWDELSVEPQEFREARDLVVAVYECGGGCTNSKSTRSGRASSNFATEGSSGSKVSRAEMVPSKPPGCGSR